AAGNLSSNYRDRYSHDYSPPPQPRKRRPIPAPGARTLSMSGYKTAGRQLADSVHRPVGRDKSAIYGAFAVLGQLNPPANISGTTTTQWRLAYSELPRGF